MFTLLKNDQITILLVNMDDVILAGTSLYEFDKIKSTLHNNFKIKDLRVLKYFLGLEVAHSREGIFISQRKYFLDLLHDTCLLASKPAATPLNPSTKLHQYGNQAL